MLRGIDLELAAGETLMVIGPNGSGKTTLLRVLATLLRPGGGEVRVLGSELPKESWMLRGRIGYVAHEPLLYRDLTCRENLLFHSRLHGIDRATSESRISELLATIGMSRRADDRVTELSAGLRQRLSICRAVLHDPDLLLLDEPDSNLDAASRALAHELIGPQTRRTRIIVTHDPERHAAEADQVLDLSQAARQSDVHT